MQLAPSKRAPILPSGSPRRQRSELTGKFFRNREEISGNSARDLFESLRKKSTNDPPRKPEERMQNAKLRRQGAAAVDSPDRAVQLIIRNSLFGIPWWVISGSLDIGHSFFLAL